MGNPNPNMGELGVSTRFPVNRPPKPHTKKGPYLIPLLRKFLEKKINYEDPETQKMINGRVKDAVIWRLILNATQGENHAIKEILDRIEGKAPDTMIDQSIHSHFTFHYDKIDENRIRATQRANGSLGVNGSVESSGGRPKIREDTAGNPRVDEESVKPTEG